MHHLETDPEFNGLGGLFRQMHSIILNPPDFLKPCIFYLLIFPRDLGIQRRRLVRRWIAEGYSKQSVERHAEENAANFFSELVELNIFQQVQRLASTNTIQVYYQVNSFIREYISRRVEENLVYELSGDCAITTQGRGRHLIILRCWHRDRVVFERADFSRLWSLTVFGKWESFISKSMKLLRFLSLRGCHEVHYLPSSLGDLKQLQTLDVRHTSIVALPASITRLYKLQYIRVGANLDSESTPSASSSSCLPEMCRRPHLAGAEAPRGIRKLTELHTLGVINVAAIEGIVILEELKKLTQLRKLGLSGINLKNSSKFLSAISDHARLESLSVWLDKGNEGCLDDINQPLENLRSLKLYGLGEELPAAVSSKDLSKLTKLDLGMAALAPSDMDHLARLPKLRILRLHVKQSSIQFCTEDSEGEELLSYEKVKVLEISGSSAGLHVTFGSKSMQSLEHLKLDCSSWSWY
ncbi:hypothetical protein CFC21_081830 [Triticum aestivum]|uniref:NB-ARC domain-containing protein n=2 Tax=Triticum aestivum TaxID=4565 RepID=A0A9R1L4M7_WHEAT|nr:hypothetical protein CFC21_081830 [Triticum aestivum]